MEIIKLPITEINPAPYNPRKNLQPDDPEYKQIEDSIDRFSLVEPLIWNRRNKHLVGGHQRFKVLVQKGFKEIEVSVVDLDLEHEKLLNIALNKVEGQWDGPKLASLLKELSQVADLNVQSIMPPAEISQVLDRYLPEDKADNFDIEAAVDSIDEPLVKRGDLIEINGHRILCGDSANPEDIKRLMDGQMARLWYTDPPYNCRYTNTRPIGKKKKSKWSRIYKDDLSQPEYEKWLEQVIVNVNDYLEPGSPVYMWNGHAQFGHMHNTLTKHGFQVGTVIVWAKERFALSFADYNQQVEHCLYAWKKGEGGHFWYGPKNETTLWTYERDGQTTLIHPTQKPTALAERAMKNSSQRGDIVIESFLGSSSALISAEKLGRKCYGVEISPAYVQAGLKRYCAFVGKDNVSKEIRQRYLGED
jgi:DNA modification methylase